MPGAIIVIDQIQGGPVSPGSPGLSREDLWLNGQVHLISSLTNASYDWQLLDSPPGSTAVLDTPAAQTCHFTPDVYGTYRIQLITNGGGAGNVQVLVGVIRFDAAGVLANRGWFVPGLGESTENNTAGNLRGWDSTFRVVYDDLLANAFFYDAPHGAAPGDTLTWSGVAWTPGPGGGGITLNAPLVWPAIFLAGLGQLPPANGGIPTTDMTISSQPPNVGGGLLTGRPGNLNFSVPSAVGGAPQGQVLFYVNGSQRFSVDDTGTTVVGDIHFFTPLLPSVGAVPNVGALPVGQEGDIRLVADPLAPFGIYSFHNGAWAGLAGGDLKGNVIGAPTANTVDQLQTVFTALSGSEELGAEYTVDTMPRWKVPHSCAWDASAQVVWVTDQEKFSLFRFDPALPLDQPGPPALTEYQYTSPFAYGLRYMRLDASFIYVTASLSFGAPPGTPNVFIFDRSNGAMIGKIATAFESYALTPDAAGNLFVAVDGNDVEKYDIAAVLTAFPAVGIATTTVPGTVTGFNSDMCFDGTYVYVNGGTDIYKIDPVAAVVVLTASPFTVGGLALGGGSLWTAAGDIINPVTMLATGTHSGHGGFGIAYDTAHDKLWTTQNFAAGNNSLWITDALLPLNPAVSITGAFPGDEPGGFAHRGIAYDSTNQKMWKACSGTAPLNSLRQGLRRYNGVGPYEEELRAVGPLTLRYVPPNLAPIIKTTGPGGMYLFAIFPTSGTVLCVDSTGGPVAVTLNGSAHIGTVITVKDSAGQAGLNNITIGGAGNPIDGAFAAVLAAPYASLTFVRIDAANWSVI